MDDKEKRKDKWGIKRVILGEIKMRITRGVFQTLGWVIMGAIAYVWLFTEGSDRTILIVVLVSLFIILSIEYVREGFAQRKSLPNKNIKCQCGHTNLVPVFLQLQGSSHVNSYKSP